MFQFCFNDCIPADVGEFALIEALTRSLVEFSKVKGSYPNDVDGIVVAKPPSVFKLNEEGMSLATCIGSIESKELRNLAYRLFTKHPVEEYYDRLDVDRLLAMEYVIEIGGVKHSAINSVIVSENNGALFTLGVHSDLRRNILTISSKSTTTIDVNNLYGADGNTSFIQGILEKQSFEKLDNFRKLLTLVGANSHSQRFASGFDGLSPQIQVAFLEHIRDAIARGGITKLFADGNLIKDVSPSNFEYRLSELRMFSPVAYRMYFYEAADKTYLAMIEKKPTQKAQANHIKAASSIIKQQIRLGGL